MSGIKLFIAPHADVRIACEDLGKMKKGIEGLGLSAPVLSNAIQMLTRLSIELEEWRTGKLPLKERDHE